MSTNVLKLIPRVPDYVPSNSAQKRACELITTYLSGTNLVTTQVTDKVRFVDAGSNWGRILCPESEIEIIPETWQEAMDKASEKDFEDLSVFLDCCGQTYSLNELRYEWPVGFAKFSIEINTPKGDLGKSELQILEQVLGCQLRKIWAHY